MLNQLQCLSLMGALLVLVAQPAKAQESSDQIDEKVAVTDKEFALPKPGVVIAKSPVGVLRSRKPQLKRSQSASLPQRAKSDEASKNISQLSEIKLPANSAQMLVQSPTPNNPPTQPGSVVAITSRGLKQILQTKVWR